MKRSEYKALRVAATAAAQEMLSAKPGELGKTEARQVLEVLAGKLEQNFDHLSTESGRPIGRPANPDDQESIVRAARKALRGALGIPSNRSGTAPSFCVCATQEELDGIRRLAEKDGSSKAAQFHLSWKIYSQIRKSSGWKKRLAEAFPGISMD